MWLGLGIVIMIFAMLLLVVYMMWKVMEDMDKCVSLYLVPRDETLTLEDVESRHGSNHFLVTIIKAWVIKRERLFPVHSS